MAQGRVKSMSGADAPAINGLSNIPTLRRAILSAPRADDAEHVEREHAARELAHLRIVNARLMRELAALQLRAAEALRLADRDGLTGLYNRRRMLELLNGAIADAAQQHRFVGLLFVDLNGFKAVNDFYGHAAGDRILTTVATRISARVRRSAGQAVTGRAPRSRMSPSTARPIPRRRRNSSRPFGSCPGIPARRKPRVGRRGRKPGS